MAGHSQFKNIMHRKGAQDAKRAKIFTKILREVTVAAKAGGPDPATNPRLRTAMHQARQANMPKDNLERAIAKAHESAETYEALQYEAMGPGQVALLIDVLTDNRNRTASEVRAALNKNGAHQADVAFLFKHVGVIVFGGSVDRVQLVESAILAGADDVQEREDGVTVICAREQFFAVKDQLESDCGAAESAQIAWIPVMPKVLDDVDQRQSLQKLLDVLHDMDDVQQVWIDAQWDEESDG